MGGGGGGGSGEDVGSLGGALSGFGEVEGLPGEGCEGGCEGGGEAAGWVSRVAYSRYGSAVRWRVNWLRKTPMKALGVAGRNRIMLERAVAHGLLCFGVARGVDKVARTLRKQGALQQHAAENKPVLLKLGTSWGVPFHLLLGHFAALILHACCHRSALKLT